ncbi:MAG: tetratricopeptide repeat protein, partial [Deltaproteobacteria bacterium]
LQYFEGPMELNAQAQRSLSAGDYAAAENMIERALDLLWAKCPDHPMAAVMLDNLALVYEKTDRAPQAQEIREKARQIRAAVRS